MKHLYRTGRAILILTATLTLLFHMTTCTRPYSDCPEEFTEIYLLAKTGANLHNQPQQIEGIVVKTFCISFLGIRTFKVSDEANALWVKAPIGSAMPPKGEKVTVCGIVRNVVDLDGALSVTLLVEGDQRGSPAD